MSHKTVQWGVAHEYPLRQRARFAAGFLVKYLRGLRRCLRRHLQDAILPPIGTERVMCRRTKDEVRLRICRRREQKAMATFFPGESHTFSEFLLVPGYSSAQ